MENEKTISDGNLLAQIAADGSQDCFQKLVQRHTSMVLGVCRRQLGEGSDAEDAAQATFLVLWDKAKGLRRRESVAGWLHRVARNVSCNARRSRQLRREREREAAELSQMESERQDGWEDIKEVLDEELDRLPEKYRLPVILFHLEERSQEEIAAMLGLRRAAVGMRLTRAREMLRSRLTKCGIPVGLAALATMLTTKAGAAAVPAAFVGNTIHAAGAIASGKLAVGGILSAQTTALTKGAIHMMTVAKVKSTAAAIAAVTVMAGGGVIVVQQVAQAQEEKEATDNTPAPQLSPGGAGNSKLDLNAASFSTIHQLTWPAANEWRHIRVNWLMDVVAARKKAAAEDKLLIIRRSGGVGYTNPFGPT